MDDLNTKASVDTNPWSQILEEKGDLLERSLNVKTLLRKYPHLDLIFDIDYTSLFANFEAFKKAMDHLYPHDSQSKIISESLQPHFDQIKVLGLATIALTKCDLNAKFLWGSLMTLIRVCINDLLYQFPIPQTHRQYWLTSYYPSLSAT